MTSPSSIDPDVVREIEERKGSQPPPGWRYAVLAASVAHLSLIQTWHALLFERDFGYFNRLPVNRASLVALLINGFALGGAIWLMARCVRRANRRSLWILASTVLCAAPLVPLNFLRTHVWHLTGSKFISAAKEPLVLVIAVLIVIGAIWFQRHATRLVATIYIIVSPMLLFTITKTAWWIIRPPRQNPGVLAPALAQKPGPHVVWLLFDELDQRITFDGPPAHLSLPELTRFYNENFRATNAFPPGGSTLYSLPALTTGHQVRGARPTGAGELSFNGGTRWSEAETVFSRARGLGSTTALVGWYHPYGRILGHVLDRCEWYAYPPFEGERGRSVSEAALNQLCSIFSQFQQRRLHIRNVEAAAATAVKFLTNSPAGLTLLHLPLPHLPGIYDAKRDRMTAWRYSRDREYLENLVLADHVFGKLRRAMETAGTWDTAWVVLSSDHWWREAVRYDGKNDHRVPFIIKAPDKNELATYGNKFNTVVTYHLILSMLKGELTDSAQLSQWLDRFRLEPPASYAQDGEPL